MSKESTEQQLRSFLVGFAAIIFIGTVAELYLLEHYEETKQWIPIILSSINFVICLAAWRNPGRSLLLGIRWLMGLTVIAALFGIYLHFSGNFAFAEEINPSFTISETFWAAVKGSNPLLAPGMIIVAAILAAAGTYRHPALK